MSPQPACPPITIVIPCYNEADRLAVETLAAYRMPDRCLELLFVDDGSLDGTLGVLKALCERAPERMSYISLACNSGKAEAVRQGMLHAMQRSPGYVGFWDADLATPLTELPRLCQILDTHDAVQMVFGSRVKLMGRMIERKAYRHYFGRILATVAALSLEIPIYDTQCGAKLFRVSDMLREVFATPFTSRWMFDVEIIARFKAILAAQGASICSAIYEVPLRTWRDVAGSKVHPPDALRAFVDLAKIRRLYRRP